MTQHTAGPWAYAYTDEDESRCGYLVTKSATNVPVAFIASANPSDGREHIARLIAAAPDLLAALQELIAEYDATELERGCIPNETGGMIQARHAIAQATGASE